ncbi:MAG: Coenzyme F420 hydrogenase/dehydrogenase, beta subunit C-terminal domain [Candidatus Bathyarchaeota archaeon]
MSRQKISFDDSLLKNVVESEKCLGCGACVVVCPLKCLEYIEEKPKLVKECTSCGICAQICPQFDWSLSSMENFVFGRERGSDEEFGIYRKLVRARTTDSKILEKCQDGGVVTALLTYALKNGLIEGAIVSGQTENKPLCPIPTLATNPMEILECAGTRYVYSPNIFSLAEAAKEKKVNIAFVGTPCQIRVVRKIQISGLKKYSNPIKVLIGLMCSECFTYSGLIKDHIKKKLGIDPEQVKKMNIKGRILVETGSEVKTISLAEAKQYVRENCKPCKDFSSELADISTGGLGLDGWTFTIIRTKEGEELFSKAEKAGYIESRTLDKQVKALDLLVKLSQRKRK